MSNGWKDYPVRLEESPFPNFVKEEFGGHRGTSFWKMGDRFYRIEGGGRELCVTAESAYAARVKINDIMKKHRKAMRMAKLYNGVTLPKAPWSIVEEGPTVKPQRG